MEIHRRTSDRMFFKLIPFFSSIFGILAGGLIFYGVVNTKLEINDQQHTVMMEAIKRMDERLRLVEKAIVSLDMMKESVIEMRSDIRDIRNMAISKKKGDG